MAQLATARMADPRRKIFRLTPKERKTYTKMPEKVFFIYHSDFESITVEHRFFGSDAEVIGTPNSWIMHKEIVEGENHWPAASNKKPLSQLQEKELFLRFNYARYRLSLLVLAQNRRFSASRAKEMLMWDARVMQLRANIVNENLGLVLVFAKRAHVEGVLFAELVSEGNMALLRAIEKFDISRGFKFSTYACRAIAKAYTRLYTQTMRRRHYFPAEFDCDCEKDNGKWKDDAQAASSVDILCQVLDRGIAGLSEKEAKIIDLRFGLTDRGKIRTLDQVAKIIGLTKERIRQILQPALKKIRAGFEEIKAGRQ